MSPPPPVTWRVVHSVIILLARWTFILLWCSVVVFIFAPAAPAFFALRSVSVPHSFPRVPFDFSPRRGMIIKAFSWGRNGIARGAKYPCEGKKEYSKMYSSRKMPRLQKRNLHTDPLQNAPNGRAAISREGNLIGQFVDDRAVKKYK